jgi:thioredoxin 1
MSRYRNSDKTYKRVNNNDYDLSDSISSGNDKEYEIITSLEQKKLILNNNRLVLIDVYGSWCQPCTMIEPLFIELVRKYKNLVNNGVYLCKEDVDKRLTEDCTAVPMFCFYLDGVKIDHINGGNMKEVEERLLKYIKVMNDYKNK